MSLASYLNFLLPPSLRPVEIAARRYLRGRSGAIQGGPFQGMRYIDRAHCSQLVPKIAGSYELELAPFFEKMIAARPDVFVDIGAAEGYYAVGAAYRGWSDKIVAFETDETARRGIEQLMQLNGVPPTRIELRGLCTPVELDDLLGEYRHPAVLMDVEGFEAFLLDPIRVPNLNRARILVEHHDFALPGLQGEVARRMSGTHRVTAIDQQPRTAQNLPATGTWIDRLPHGIRRRMLSEQRPFSQHGWLYLEPTGPV